MVFPGLRVTFWELPRLFLPGPPTLLSYFAAAALLLQTTSAKPHLVNQGNPGIVNRRVDCRYSCFLLTWSHKESTHTPEPLSCGHCQADLNAFPGILPEDWHRTPCTPKNHSTLHKSHARHGNTLHVCQSSRRMRNFQTLSFQLY